jgi:protein-S-isoprenylcysteine O-methyltransferase Ste14
MCHYSVSSASRFVGLLYGCRVLVGVVIVLFGQFLRSAAMIKASSNFSHMVAFRKLVDHRLVTDGVYRFVVFQRILSTLLTWSTDGQGTHHTPVFFIGP